MADNSATSDTTTLTSDDLAAQALASVQDKTSKDEEVEASDEVAETLNHLQTIIERYARELQTLQDELKHKREELSNIFENDSELAVVEEQAQQAAVQVKSRRSQLQGDQQVTSLKVQIGELNEQKKELEETLSNHLVNYHSITHSTSFDTSDGDQWEFSVRAKVKGRKK